MDINQIITDQINVLVATQSKCYDNEDYGLVIDISQSILLLTESAKELIT